MSADGTGVVLLRRLDALELAIRKVPAYPGKADLEFTFDQVLSTAKRLTGTRTDRLQPCVSCGEPTTKRWCSTSCMRADGEYHDDDDYEPDDDEGDES